MVRKHSRFGMRAGGDPTVPMTVVALALGALVLLSPGLLQAQAKVGTTGAQFLELGVSARAMGMAEAYTAVSDDITSIYYNPAGLTYLYGRELGLTYIGMPADINYGLVAFGLPLESVGGVVGFGFYGLHSSYMDVTDYFGIPTGQEFAWQDFALSVSYGRYLTDRFSIGLTVKYIREEAFEYSANGWSADVGTIYNTGFRGFKIAMIINNFGPDMTFTEREFPLPINFKFGGSINAIDGVDHVLTLAAEGSHPSDNLEKYNSGLEYTFRDRFSLRAGGRFNYDVDGFTAGGGLRLPFGEDQEIRLDYAFQDWGVLTEVHRFSMIIAF
ncbi:MAG: PorV/PorQ family protein [Candidatus Zixiibacteriota bacterium]